MATAAHRARDRGASGDGRSLSESGRDRGAAAGCVGTATAGKTGQREPGDHRVGRGKPTHTINPKPNPTPENLSTKGKAKATSKPANAVTTGFGVESTGLEIENPKRIRSASACEPFREAIELGLSRRYGRDGRERAAESFPCANDPIR